MHSGLRGLLVVASLASVAGAAKAADNFFLSLQPQSKLWVEGTSTVRGFTCKAGEVDATVQVATTGAVQAVVSGEKVVSAVDVKVPAGKLDCGNGTMNGHMAKALKSAEFPAITFVLGAYEPGPTGTVSGQLTLGGVTKPVTLKASAKDADGALQLTGAYELDMTAFGIKPPTLMMGTMKVGKVVTVHFDLLVKG